MDWKILYFDVCTFSSKTATYSCDMIRLSGRFFENHGVERFNGRDEILSFIRIQCSLEYKYFEYTGGAIGKYRDVFTFTFENGGTATLLLCPRLGTGKPDWPAWVLEYNPNKVLFEQDFRTLFNRVLNYSWEVDIKRWDLAVDVKALRSNVVLIRDARLYECYQRSAENFTEYLGERNKPGRVKVYNKALEKGLEEPLTRIEITLPFPCSLSQLQEFWPDVRVYGDFTLEAFSKKLSPSDAFIVHSILEFPCLERWLSLFNRQQRPKKKALLDGLRKGLEVEPELYKRVQLFLLSQLSPLEG